MFKLFIIFISIFVSTLAHTTFVSLTFDDGLVEHYPVSKILNDEYGMKATFYINSGRLGEDRVTASQLKEMQSDGHEIAGHTINHENLASSDNSKRIKEICDDKSNLEENGLTIESFAFPFGADFEGADEIFEDCGYKSARDSGGLKTDFSCEPCPEALEPSNINIYRLKSISYRLFTMSADFLMRQIDRAQEDIDNDHWIIFVFHEVGDFPSERTSITYPELHKLLKLLSDASYVEIKRVNELVDNVVNYGLFVKPTSTSTSTSTSTTLMPTSTVSETSSSEISPTLTVQTTTVQTTLSETTPPITENSTNATNTTSTTTIENSSSGVVAAAVVVPVLLIMIVSGILFGHKYYKRKQFQSADTIDYQFDKSVVELQKLSLPNHNFDMDLESQYNHNIVRL